MKYCIPIYAVFLAIILTCHAQTPVRVACVGDSITFGYGTTSSFNSYPSQLGRMLGDQWTVMNFGISSKTLMQAGDQPYTATDAVDKVLQFKPDIIVVQLGTNDTKPKNWKFKDQFPADYKALLARFQTLDSHPRIFLCLPPAVSGSGHYGINEPSLLEEIPMVQAVASELNLQVIDVHAATLGKDALFPDLVHPNNEGANLIARTVYRALTGNDYTGELPTVSIDQWNGYELRTFETDGRLCSLVVPKQALPGNPWIWRTEFFGVFPKADIALAEKGFYIAYIDVSNMYGAPMALDHMDKFYDFLTSQDHLSAKTNLEGLSRGGLFAFNWAVRHPERVASIYADAPVCDFKSWPGGKGKSAPAPADWQLLLKVYQLTEAQALTYPGNPIDNLEPLSAAKIPILGVYGDADTTVPPAENILLLAQRYKNLGGEIELIPKPGIGHHPHGLDDPTPIVNFIVAHLPPSS